MSLFASLLLLQSGGFVGVAPERTPQMDASLVCLTKGVEAWLTEHDWEPGNAERWRWATKITDKCEPQLKASIRNMPLEGSVAEEIRRKGGSVRLTRFQMHRSEALYYADRLIREHFEQVLEQQQ